MKTAAGPAITLEELQLAARNHGLPLEALRHDVTPLGLHYLLTHFDIPHVDEVPRAVSAGHADWFIRPGPDMILRMSEGIASSSRISGPM